VTPPEILATHLLEIIKRNLSRLLSMRALQRLIDEFTNLSDATRAEANRRLLGELVPEKVSLDTLHQVLRLLLDEQVSIRNLSLILESIAEGRHSFTSAEGLCEYVRQKLGFQLVGEMQRADGTLPLLQLAPEWEDIFSQYQIESGAGSSDVALPPEEFNRLANAISEKINASGESGVFPAVLTSVQRRRFLRTILQAKGISAPVLSFEEIARDAKPSVVGLVAA
jgi:flagellar biosynthesis protein FlhA